MRLIDADALNIRKYTRWFEDPADERQVERMIREAPTIDAVPVVHGEWVPKRHVINMDNMTLTGTYPTCSLCDYAMVGVEKNANHCSRCGAKMNGGSDNA